MSRGKALAGAMVLGAAWVAGCGGGGGPAPITAQALPAELAAATCARAYECCTTAQLAGSTLAGSDAAGCQPQVVALYGVVYGNVAASEMKGRLVYHADKAAACVGALKAAACDDLNHNGPVKLQIAHSDCSRIIEPLGKPGEACTDDNECMAGVCKGAGGGRDGACVARVAVGMSCTFTSDCVSGTYCGDGNKCAVPKSDGAPCGRAEECAGGACNGISTGMGLCGAPPVDPGKCFLTSSSCAAAPLGARGGAPLAGLGLAVIVGVACARGRRRGRRRG